jgi:hypothetical protein
MATATKRRPAPSRRTELSAAQTAETVARVSTYKPVDFRAKLQSIADEARNQLGTLSTQIEDTLTVRDELDIAIAAKKAELSSLTGMAEEALGIDDLRAKREAAEADFAAYQVELAQNRTREQKEFDYNLKRGRDLERDNYNDQLAQRNKADQERRAKIEADLAARVDAIKSQEGELASLRDQVARFPEVLKAEISKAEAIAKNALTREFEHQKALAAAEARSNEQLAELTAASLKAENASLKAMIAQLNAQVAESQINVREIAAKAVESASGRAALDAVSQLATTSGPQAAKTSR